MFLVRTKLKGSYFKGLLALLAISAIIILNFTYCHGNKNYDLYIFYYYH